MQFVMTGFDQDAGVRQYAFKGIAERIRTEFTVGVELALIPSYGIRIQELPLLCRELLERRGEGAETRTLTFTEDEMRVCASDHAAAREAAAQKKRKKSLTSTADHLSRPASATAAMGSYGLR